MELEYVNIARLFLVRPLGLIGKNEFLEPGKVNTAEILRKFNFKEAYFYDAQHPTEVENPVFLLFQPQNLDEFQEFVKLEYEESYLVEDYDYPDNYVVLVYKFPEIYKDDYKLIRQGRYSRTSYSYQSLFPEKKEGVTSTYNLIFKRDKRLRKAMEERYNTIMDEEDELYHFPDMRKETLDITKILNAKKDE